MLETLAEAEELQGGARLAHDEVPSTGEFSKTPVEKSVDDDVEALIFRGAYGEKRVVGREPTRGSGEDPPVPTSTGTRWSRRAGEIGDIRHFGLFHKRGQSPVPAGFAGGEGPHETTISGILFVNRKGEGVEEPG